MTKKTTITACVIAKDNQNIITDCLESLTWADEVLLVDTGSTDMTVDIAKRLGARVVHYKKGSYNDWRNKGLKEANGEWILYIDSDERVTDKLRDEVTSITKSTNYVAFAIPRKNRIFGKEFKYGGEYPDYQRRLFRKSKLKKWTGELHEQPVIDGDLGYLSSHILHLKHNNLSDMVTKTNWWSEKEAKLMFDANHPPMNVRRFVSAMVREFWDRMIKKKGYKDGPEGIIYSLYQVFSKFVSYAKLWEMQVHGKNDK